MYKYFSIPTFRSGVAVCTSQEQYDQANAEFWHDLGKKRWLPKGAAAVVFEPPKKSGSSTIITCFDIDNTLSLHNLIDSASHEATHIKQAEYKRIGEWHPGGESEAYLIAYITMELLKAILGEDALVRFKVSDLIQPQQEVAQ